MFQQHLQQLSSPDPAQRRQAIIALANSGDPRTLTALRKVISSESDPALRQLAERAARHVETKQAAAPDAPKLPEPPTMNKPTPSDSAELPGYASNWSQQIQQMNESVTSSVAQARGQVNNAFGSYNSGDKAGAQVYLARALALNPAQADNPEVRTLASELTGLPPDDAIKRLSAPPGKGQLGIAAPQGPPVAVTADSCTTMLLELALLFVALVISFMLTFTSIRQSAGALTPSATNSRSSTTQQAATQQAITQIIGLGSSLVLVYAGIGAAVSVIAFLVWNTLVNTFSVMALGGQGDWSEFMHVMLRIQIIGVIVGTIPVILPLLSARASLAAQVNASSLASTVSGVAGLGLVIAQIYFTSRIHKIDWFRGCIAVVMTPFIFACGCLILVIIASSFGRVTTG